MSNSVAFNAEQVVRKHDLEEAALQRDVGPDGYIAYTPGIFIIALSLSLSSPRLPTNQMTWCTHWALPPVSPYHPSCRRTPTQTSRHCERTEMCMSYTRLICRLMGNVLFSRSHRGDRFKSWREITCSFFSLFPLLKEEHCVFTLPTYFTAPPKPPRPTTPHHTTPLPPHSAPLLSDKRGEPFICPPTYPHSLKQSAELNMPWIIDVRSTVRLHVCQHAYDGSFKRSYRVKTYFWESTTPQKAVLKRFSSVWLKCFDLYTRLNTERPMYTWLDFLFAMVKSSIFQHIYI